MTRRAPLALALGLLAGCGDEEILHGLAEPQANEVLVALYDSGIDATKRRDDGAEGSFTVAVPPSDAARAQRVLAERSLPRAKPAGFADVFARASMVPTPTEEHALYLHALGGELARSVEAVEGVVEARVHLGLPQPDPLRPGERPRPRAAVLVKCRPASCAGVRALEGGIRALVAGAADGLEAGAVSLVVTEASASAPREPSRPPRRGAAFLVALAGLAALGAAGVGAVGLRSRLRREVTT